MIKWHVTVPCSLGSNACFSHLSHSNDIVPFTVDLPLDIYQFRQLFQAKSDPAAKKPEPKAAVKKEPGKIHVIF